MKKKKLTKKSSKLKSTKRKLIKKSSKRKSSKTSKKLTKRKSNPDLKTRIRLAEERLGKAQEELDKCSEAGISSGSSLGLIVYGEYLSAKNRLDDLMWERE